MAERDAETAVNWCERDPRLVGERLVANARTTVDSRRAAIRAAGLDHGHHPVATLGLALSGGGIRSATISLGAIQGLARAKRLLDFDYCSTVSGGGYCGSFLGGLFLPDYVKGDKGGEAPGSGARDMPDRKAAFGLDALSSAPRSTLVEAPHEGSGGGGRWIYNPIWWLREHSRYLAPNGTSDYLAAISYLVRNWLAMIYVFILPVAAASMFLLSFCIAMRCLLATLGYDGVFDVLILEPRALSPCEVPRCVHQGVGVPLSPLFLTATAILFCALAVGIAYWLTTYMSSGGNAGIATRNAWLWSRKLVLAGAASGFFLLFLFLGGLVIWACSLRVWPPNLQATLQSLSRFVAAPVLSAPSGFFTSLFLVSFALLMVAILLAFFAHRRAWPIWIRTGSADAYIAEVRRLLSRLGTRVLFLLSVTLVAALIDSAARWIYLLITSQTLGLWGGLSALLVPAGAWIINKVPGWFADGNGRMTRFLGKQLWTIALIAGVGLYGLLATAVHVVVQFLLFAGEDWMGPQASREKLLDPSEPPGFFIRWGLSVLLIGVQFIAVGRSNGFINLSSLHGLYAARLTRAYLGAANIARLADQAASDRESRITETHAGDQIEIGAYQRAFAEARNLAPMHLINTTLNETRSPQGSQLLERDRKGVPLVFAPEGIFIDPGKEPTDRTYYSWEQLEGVVESLSVGQLCAISGAAASSAMGSRTTLGSALALSFANIRLGYWWNVRGLLTRPKNEAPVAPKRGIRALAETYAYLLREMRASYDRQSPRLNISDGGHFENSGAYELLRRNVPTILVCDNGADPFFHFEDLEQLIRKARIDLGIEIIVAAAPRVIERIGIPGSDLFLNGRSGQDWRCRAASRASGCTAAVPHDPAFCLLLEARQPARPDWHGTILWLKPRLFEGLDVDVAGYATNHPSFPNETTGDQFFDEAQWESYRKLGQTMIERLLAGTPHGAELFRRFDQGLRP